MSHITRRAAAEQRSNKKLTPEQKLTRKVTTGVTKSRQVPNDKQVGEKWTKKHNNVRKVEDKKEVLALQNILSRLEEEITELEKRPDSHERKIMLTSALARKKDIEKKLGIDMDVEDDEGPSVLDTLEEDGDGDNQGHEISEEIYDQETGSNQHEAEASIEGNKHDPDEADNSTEKTFDKVPWDIRASSPIEGVASSSGQPIPIGYRKKGSGRTYLVRYGTPGSCSTRFESNPDFLPQQPEQSLVDVACRKHRIIERIIQWHKDQEKPVPDDILCKAQILNVYWDSKELLGSEAEPNLEEVLGPKPQSRTSVRCVVYLDPQLYAEKGWGIENKTGLSHETRTTMLSCIGGISRKSREVDLYNIAVRLENRYRKMFQPTEDPLLPYDDPQSVPTKSSRRTALRRSPTRQPHPTTSRPETDCNDQELRIGDFEPGPLRTRRQLSEWSREETPALTEQSMERIMERFMKDFVDKLKDKLIDEVTEKVLEKLGSKG